MIALYGDIGAQWLADLPNLISRYENLWQFKSEGCFSDVQYNVVLSVMQNNGVPAVFKCCVPNRVFETEVKALLHYDGFGAAQVLKSDVENGAMLLEKIIPGTLLEEIVSVDEATKKAVDVCKKLHKPIEDVKAFPSIKDWFEEFEQSIYQKFNGTSGPFDEKLIGKAKTISDALLSSQSNIVLLHGDLHYANLLLTEGGFAKSIDAKGLLGEPEFEIPLPRITNLITKKIIISTRLLYWTLRI